MPIPNEFTDLSDTPSNNSPAGTESARGTIDDYIRKIFSFISRLYALVNNAQSQANIGVANAQAANQAASSAYALANTANSTANTASSNIASLTTTVAGKQNALGFTPVRQGGGVGQTNNILNVGWSLTGLKASVDGADVGRIWTAQDFAADDLWKKSETTSTTSILRLPNGYTFLTGVFSVGTDQSILVNLPSTLSIALAIFVQQVSGSGITGTVSYGGHVSGFTRGQPISSFTYFNDGVAGTFSYTLIGSS